jgi:hypothetical protein
MKIKMLIDFRGRETNEQYYQAGQTVDLPDDIAARLVADKRAELAEQPTPQAQPAAKERRKR